MQQLMRMGQQLQEKMVKLQARLDGEEISASSGGGMVTATVDGKGRVTKIVVDPTVVDPRDVEMLEDLVLAALTKAQSEAREALEREMKQAAGGLPMPGLDSLLGG